jgi:probable rRNA maturation factor
LPELKILITLEKRVAGLSEASLARFVEQARRAAGFRDLVNVLVTGSSTLRRLNRRFRGKDKATDVLSFPRPPEVRAQGRKDSDVGADIAISAEIAAQNAARLGHSRAEEVKILALHGILHLAGFDHERDNGRMARKEAKLRRALKLPVALIERAQTAERKKRTRSRGPAGRSTA